MLKVSCQFVQSNDSVPGFLFFLVERFSELCVRRQGGAAAWLAVQKSSVVTRVVNVICR